MYRKWFPHLALAIALLASLLAGMLPVAGLAQSPEQPAPPGAGVQDALLAALAEEGATAGFFVVMAEQADLGPAYEIEDWQARGEFVYETLRETAARSQAPVIAYAQDRGLAYRSFLTNNAVYIEAGDLRAVDALARLPGVAQVRLPEVATVQPSQGQSPEASPNSFGWNLDSLDPTSDAYGMQAAQVWQQYGITGEGIVVANIDTGAYYQHVALDRQYRGNTTGSIGGPYEHDFSWYQPNYIPCGNGTFPCDSDYYGHGTGTIGIMTGETPDQSKQIGVAPGAKWISCMGCDDPPYCTEAALTACADWMVAPCPIGADPGDPACDPDKRPHVVNNSWGGGGCSTWYQPMVQAWTAAGIFPAFAAGNAGGCGTVASPGDLPESFGVAAHWTNGDNAYSGGPSCFYPTPTCDPDAHDIDPHVNAPTGGETAANSQATYSALGGTSGASPHVAGAVALLWSANPGLIGQIEATFTVLEQSANRDRPATFCGKPACAGTNDYPNYDFGWGYLDALAAVQMAGAGGLGELEGTVTEASPLEVPGDPLPDVAITAQRQGSLYSLQAQTGASGYYSTTLPAGTYTVTADGPFHGPETVTGLSITTGTLSIQDFQLLPKGRLHGYVTEAEGGTPLEATVRTAEVDPVGTDPATGLYSIYLGQGSHDVIVEANNYASQTVPIDIVSGQEITQDFALVPALDVAPWPIQASVELSGTLDVSTVITNRTAAAYDMSLSHAAARAGDEGPILLVDDENLEENPAAFAIALSNLGYDYVTIDAQAFVSSTITELLNYGAVIYAGTAAAGAEQKQIIAYLDAGGRFLLADGSFTLYHQDSRLHRVYLQAIYDGLYEWAGPQTGLDIMAGLYPDISSAVVVYDSFAGPEGVGIFQAASSNFSGIRTARAGYRAIYLSFDLNRIGAREPGDADETAVVYPAMLWLLGYPVEAPWYSTDVSGGVVPANSSLTFASEFSTLPATGIDQPGEFYAQLHVEPAAVGEIYPRLDVPVQLTVLPRPTMGRLAGTITSDRPTGPMAAPVTIEDGGGGSWTTTSDWWTGGYGYWLDAGNYTVSIVADGYYTETAQVTITAGMTTTQDFAMILAAPEISVSPATMEEALSFGETATRTLQIGNSGPEKLVFDVNERDRGVTQLPMSLLEATPEGVDGARILFDAYHGGNATYYTELLGDLGALGATVDIWSSGYITSSALAGYDILFIGDYLDVEYRFDELDAIDAFVRDGGGLFVTYECCDDTTAPRVTKMFDIVYIGEGGTGGTTHDVYPHPTTRGVGAIYMPSPQYLMTATVTGTAEIIVYDVGGDPALAVNEVGNGKVLVMPDDQLWDGVYDQADNTQLGRNIFGWLYGDVPWVASVPVSGTIAAGESLTLTVTFDAGAVDEPAIYYGDLILPNNDPLAPSPAVSLTLTVEPAADQGRLMGTVTSDRPGGPLAADVLVEDGEGVTLTLYSLPSTGEYHRWLTGGVYTLTASATGYVTQTAAIEVPAGGSAVLDFELALDAPAATALPGAVEETVVWGMTATRRLTVGNTGLQDLDFDLVEEDLGWVPGIEQASPAFGFDYENDNFVTFPVDDPGNWTIVAPVPYESYDGGDFWWNDLNTIYVIKGSYLYTVDPATGEDDYLAHIGQPYPHRWTSLTIAEDGTLYGVTDYWYGLPGEVHESYLWTIEAAHGIPTMIGQITNAEFVMGVAINRNGEMYGLDVEQNLLLQIDPATGAGTVIGPIGFDIWNGSLDFDDDSGLLYLAAYEYLPNQGHLNIVDTATGALTRVGDFPAGAALSYLAIAADGRVDIPWLAEAPTTGSVPAGSELGIDLTFDASGVAGPGTYMGNLHIESNDPILPSLPVPVTMTVLASGDLGEVSGMVTGTGYCDAEAYPLEADIVLEAAGGMTYTLTSDPASGYYSRWVPAGSYTLTASAMDHLTAAVVVEVQAMETTVQDFALRLQAPCLEMAPTTYSLTLSVGTVWTERMTVTNSGAQDSIWALRETTDTLAIVPTVAPVPPIPRFEGELPPDPEPTSIEPLAPAGERPENLDGGSAGILLGEPANGLDTSTFDLVEIPDTTQPGTWTVLANVGTFYSGGDFWHGDFTKMYALDFFSNEFVTLEMATGARTVIGMAHTPPGHYWTGLTAATDGSLYAMSTNCDTASTLHTIDRLTGAATVVGTTNAAPCLIDLAINAQGEIYAVDISSDALFQIDPSTGAATAIGLLGFAANHAQSLDFEEETGILYWAAADQYNGSLRRIDTNSGASLHVGYFPNYTGVDCLAFATGGGEPFWGDVPWLSETPADGVTLAGEATQVDVVLDTTNLTMSECYTAALGLLHDDAYLESPYMLPVNLCAAKPWPVYYLTKTVSAGNMSTGAPLTYTIIMGNDGSLETGIVVSDVLPAGVEYAWSSPSGAYDPAAHALRWNVPMLDGGQRLTVTVGATLALDMVPGTWMSNTAYLWWRGEMMTSTAWLGMESGTYIYLPLVYKAGGEP